LIHIPFGTTGGVGELANILMTTAYLLLPAFIYRFKKGFTVVAFSLILGVIFMVAAGLLVNRYINFPLFYGESAATSFSSLWIFILFFNLIKGVAISLLTCLLYKTVSRLYTKFN
ncbi:MAG: hypothetical protein IJY26_00810, partial [Clostridia bacterium]|nr:hypothetical protein [Clostridia bacterium]